MILPQSQPPPSAPACAHQQTGLPLPSGHPRATHSLHGGLDAPPTVMTTPRHPFSQASQLRANPPCPRQAGGCHAGLITGLHVQTRVLLRLCTFSLRLKRDGSKHWPRGKDAKQGSHVGRGQASLGRTRQGHHTSVWQGRPGHRLPPAQTSGAAGWPRQVMRWARRSRVLSGALTESADGIPRRPEQKALQEHMERR